LPYHKFPSFVLREYFPEITGLNWDNQDWDIKPPQGAAGTQRKTSFDRPLRACGALRRLNYLY